MGGLIQAEVFSFRSVSMGLCEALHHTLAQLEGLHRPYRMSQTRRSRLRPAGDTINELGPAAPPARAPPQHFCWEVRRKIRKKCHNYVELLGPNRANKQTPAGMASAGRA